MNLPVVKLDLSPEGKYNRLRMSQNSVLKGVFATKIEATEGWKKCILKIFIKYQQGDQSRRMRYAGHIARIGEIKMDTKCWAENLMGRDIFGDIGVD